MRYITTRLLSCVALLLLGACGIKGALYLPPPPKAVPPLTTSQSAPAQPAAEGSKTPPDVAPSR